MECEPSSMAQQLPSQSDETLAASQDADQEKILDSETSKETVKDPNIVDFDENDPGNPREWSLWRKWTIVLLVAVILMVDNFATTMIVPAVPQVLQDFNETSQIYGVILVTIWELGEGAGQFFVGPLSEIFGRTPVFHIGNLLFILANVACALSTNMSMLVAFRFIAGFVTTSLTLGPSIIGDLFAKEDRGTAMALAMSIPMIGPFASPPLGAVINATLGWRWTAWIIAIVTGALAILALFFFRETYAVKILERKCQRLQEETSNKDLQPKHHQDLKKFSLVQTLLRPLTMTFLSPVVFIVSFFTALTYGYSFLILTTLTEILEDRYHLSSEVIGTTFIGRAVGNVIGIIVYSLVSDRYIKYVAKKRGESRPEDRLPLMLVGAIALPLGLIMYGWTLQETVQWIVPIIATGVVGFSVLLTVLPTENYLVDVYEVYGASAIAAGVIQRALFAAVLPLAGPPLYDALNLGWGNSLLALIAALFLPFLFLLYYKGHTIRKNDRFA